MKVLRFFRVLLPYTMNSAMGLFTLTTVLGWTTVLRTGLLGNQSCDFYHSTAYALYIVLSFVVSGFTIWLFLLGDHPLTRRDDGSWVRVISCSASSSDLWGYTTAVVGGGAAGLISAVAPVDVCALAGLEVWLASQALWWFYHLAYPSSLDDLELC